MASICRNPCALILASFRHKYPVNSYILRMFPYTFILVLASMFIALVIGLPSGILSALYRRNPLIDYSARLIALLGLSMPVFWFGILLLMVFSLYWDIFPLIGGGDLTTVLDAVGSGEIFTYLRTSWRRWGTCCTTWFCLPLPWALRWRPR